MSDHYHDYTRDELIRLLHKRERKPRFGLVWEREETDIKSVRRVKDGSQ